MKAYGSLIQGIALRRAAAWQSGRPFMMQAFTQALSLEVIIKAVFGARHQEGVQQFATTIAAYFQAFTSLLVYFPPLRQPFGGIGPWSRFTKVAVRFE